MHNALLHMDALYISYEADGHRWLEAAIYNITNWKLVSVDLMWERLLHKHSLCCYHCENKHSRCDITLSKHC